MEVKSFESNECWSICDACLQEKKKYTTASQQVMANSANQHTLRLRSAQATKNLVNA
jgi:hypothetical protein